MLKEYIGKTTVASLIKLIKTELAKYVKTTTMDDRIPQPTVDDDGKFVQVINGKYTPAKHDDTLVPSAEIGQTVVVKAVDENGKPVEWEAVDFPTGGSNSEWTLIGEVTTVEPVAIVSVTSDVVLDEMIAYVSVPPIEGDTGGTIYVRPVLRNQGAINANVGLNKPSANAQRELWYFRRGWGERQYWKGSPASAAIHACLSEGTILAVQDDYDNGGGIIGFSVNWNQGYKFPAGIVMRVWGRKST